MSETRVGCLVDGWMRLEVDQRQQFFLQCATPQRVSGESFVWSILMEIIWACENTPQSEGSGWRDFILFTENSKKKKYIQRYILLCNYSEQRASTLKANKVIFIMVELSFLTELIGCSWKEMGFCPIFSCLDLIQNDLNGPSLQCRRVCFML